MKDTSQPKQSFEFLTLDEPFALKANFVIPTRTNDTRKSCIDKTLSLNFKYSFSMLNVNLALGLFNITGVYIIDVHFLTMKSLVY